MSTKTLRSRLLQKVKPITRLVGNMHAPYSRKQLRHHHVRMVAGLCPGTVLLTRTHGEASNLLIPGKFKHAGIVGPHAQSVVEATGAGVVATSIEDFVMSKDALAAFVPTFCDADDMEAAAGVAWDWIGLPYDYEFKSGYDAFYCFELTYSAYREALRVIDVASPWELRTTWGEPTVVADDFLKARSKWQVVMDTTNALR